MSRQEKKERQAKAEAAYKSFTKDIQSIGRKEDPKRVQEIISDHLSKSADLYPLIRKKLSGSSADARHMKNLLNLCSETAKRINTRSRPFDLKRAIVELKREHKSRLNQFITESYADCLATPPTFEFFYGAIKSTAFEVKQRKKRIKIQTDNTQPVSARVKNLTTECEQDSTPKEVEQICNRIKRLSEVSGGSGDRRRGVKFFATIVEPRSFTQTVENIFHTSFLVKEGRVGIRKDDTSNEPVITYESVADCTQDRDKPKKQSILSFNMSDFNRWSRQASES